MSNHVDEKLRSSKVPGLIRIVGGKLEARRERKKVRGEFETAKKDLSPWIHKGEKADMGEVLWLNDELQTFNAEVAKGLKLGKTDFAGGRDVLIHAREIATNADVAREQRAEATLAISENFKALNLIKTRGDKYHELYDNNARLKVELDDGNPVAGIIKQAGDIADEIEELKLALETPDSEEGGLLKVGVQARNEQLKLIVEAYNEEELTCRKLVYQLVDAKDLKSRDRAVSTEISKFFFAVYTPMRTGKDKPGLSGDALVQDIEEQGTAAIQTLREDCEKFRKSLAKDKGASFLKASQEAESKEKDSTRLAEERKKFETDFQAVEKALATLRDLGGPEVEQLTDKAAKDKENIVTAETYAAGDAVINVLMNMIALAKTKALNNAKGEAVQLLQAIATLKNLLTSQKKKSHKRVQPAYDKLLTELDQLNTVAKTNNIGAFNAARQSLAGIQAAGIGAVAAITAFNDTADAVEAVTGDGDVAKQFKDENDEILLAVKTVMEKFDLHNLAAAATTFDGLKVDALALKGKLESLVQWRAAVKVRLKALDDLIGKFRDGVKKDDGIGKPTTFEQNRKKVAEQYRKPGVDRDAVTLMLTTAEGAVWRFLNQMQDPTTRATAVDDARDDVQAAALITENEKQDKANAKQVRKDLQKALDAYDKKWKEVEKLVNADEDGNKFELSELKELGSQARDKFKNHDDEGAAKHLKSISDRLDKLEASPGGVTSESIKDLETVSRKWDTALGSVATNLGYIKTAAQKTAKGPPVLGIEDKQIADPIEALLERFKGYQIPDAVLTLASKKADLKVRKAAREQALHDIAAVRAILTGDPMIAKLEGNPFGFRKPFADLKLFLDDTEYNALRAVPTKAK